MSEREGGSDGGGRFEEEDDDGGGEGRRKVARGGGRGPQVLMEAKAFQFPLATGQTTVQVTRGSGASNFQFLNGSYHQIGP